MRQQFGYQRSEGKGLRSSRAAGVVVPVVPRESRAIPVPLAEVRCGGTRSTHMTVEWTFDPAAVRLRASSIAGCIALPPLPHSTPSSSLGNADHSVVSFLVGYHHPEKKDEAAAAGQQQQLQKKETDGLARVTVYCDTGTIATGRPCHNGTTIRHTFRRQVTSLDVVEHCLRHPAELTVVDWNLIVPTTESSAEGMMVGDGVGQEEENNQTNRLSIDKNLELVEIGAAILGGERDKLIQHIQALENRLAWKQQQHHNSVSAHNTNKKLEPSTPTTTTPSTTTTTGLEFQFSLSAGPMKHVDQCLNDINKMGKLVRGVATNGIGTVFLYGNGGVAYTPTIPRALYHRLSQLRDSRVHSSRPSYVALGSRDRYYVAFHDGTFACKGPKGLEKLLLTNNNNNVSNPPRSVAFGGPFEAFFVVFSDGSYKHQGKGIPIALEQKLSMVAAANNNNNNKLACVSLGPSGEWFVRYQDDRVDFGGVHRDVESAMQDLLNNVHELRLLDFGEHGSYLASYD